MKIGELFALGKMLKNRVAAVVRDVLAAIYGKNIKLERWVKGLLKFN